jgi:hypothetical protein
MAVPVTVNWSAWVVIAVLIAALLIGAAGRRKGRR